MPPTDSTLAKPPGGANRRTWLVVRIGLWLIVGAWFAWFACARWTTRPAVHLEPKWVRGPRDMPPELVRLIGAVPTPPPASMPATTALVRVMPGEISYLVSGPWDTAGRPELARLAG